MVLVPHQRSYPFDELGPGQWFRVMGRERAGSVRSVAYRWKQRLGHEFRVRMEQDSVIVYRPRRAGEPRYIREELSPDQCIKVVPEEG